MKSKKSDDVLQSDLNLFLKVRHKDGFARRHSYKRRFKAQHIKKPGRRFEKEISKGDGSHGRTDNGNVRGRSIGLASRGRFSSEASGEIPIGGRILEFGYQ